MPYLQLYYHIIWATKKREPLISHEVEPELLGFIRQKVLDLEGTVFALNGYLDHVHLISSVPPKLSLSKFIGQVKAVSSFRFNQTFPGHAPIYWQAEYGVFSFDRKRLPNFVAYVERQKEHHGQNSLISVLEMDSSENPHRIQEAEEVYASEDPDRVVEILKMYSA